MEETSQELNKLLIAKDDVDLKLLDAVEEHSTMLDLISEKLDEVVIDNSILTTGLRDEITSLKDHIENLEIEIEI